MSIFKTIWELRLTNPFGFAIVFTLTLILLSFLILTIFKTIRTLNRKKQKEIPPPSRSEVNKPTPTNTKEPIGIFEPVDDYSPITNTNNPEIKIIKSVPEHNSSIFKRIGYTPNNKFAQEELYKYAVVKMPQKNCPIKFPRKGRSDKKGFKEDDFFIDLYKHFQKDFSVFNDKHIPVNSRNIYEPDFVITSEKDNKNIFIDIEIDEPYDLLLKTPIHCIGENDIRDDFFTKRGWIVIRFAEEQVHREPKRCCALIAKVIHSIDSTYYSELLNEEIPNQIEQWDNLQAKKWAFEKYREKYLGINNIGIRPNVITEYKIIESEADRSVEKEVPRSNPKPRFKNGDSFTPEDNRDSRIEFDPIEHRYFIDENPDTISATQLIDKFFPDYDRLYWSRRKAIERLIAKGEIQTEEKIVAIQNVILKEWDDKRIASANKGTALHEAIENYYKGKPFDSNSIEFQYFLSFKQMYPNMKPFKSEWRIFDEDLLIAGTIDMVYEKESEDRTLYMFDWKRSEKVVLPPRGEYLKLSNPNSIYAEFGFGELNHLTNDSYYKYALQQNIYKTILEKKYRYKVSSMNLLILHENYETYVHKKIPEMQREVNYIFNYALLRR